MTKSKKAKKNLDNVVIFPKAKEGIPPQTLEEMRNKISISKIEIASLLAEELTKENLRIIFDHGYDVANTKDIAFLMVVIKSILLRCENIEYPIQALIDEHIESIDEETIE